MKRNASKIYDCGIVTLWTADLDDVSFWSSVKSARDTVELSFAILYFSKSHFEASDICRKLAQTCPGMPYAACSTAGEITPAGMEEGQIVAILLPARLFDVHPLWIDDIVSAGFQSVFERVSVAKREFLKAGNGDAAEKFALCFIDGMSFAEETVTAALHWGLDDIPLLGGSAGDNMNFSDTCVILNGKIGTNCAVLLLVRSKVPFRIFKTDNFVPTENKLVVTRSDPERRIVYEFNAAPAAEEYARIIGMDAGSLSPLSFASHPLVVRVGGQYYCRSIQKMNQDGSLSFFCAIDDGIVLTVAEPEGMAQTTSAVFDTVRSELGSIDMILGFDCVLRRIDAENRQVKHKISEIYRDNNVVGFNTYGEQHISMHLNQTFTGIAFSAPEHTG
ncbi:MAG: FIST N-terminal domain-containing protein [Pseudomonadota bacterium]